LVLPGLALTMAPDEFVAVIRSLALVRLASAGTPETTNFR
jgi:hypothetical protein